MDKFLKVNTHGAFHPNTGEGGWGFVIRGEVGGVVEQAEVLACIRGVTAAIAKGIDKLILETDSLTVVQALETDSYRLAEIGGSLFDLKCLNCWRF